MYTVFYGWWFAAELQMYSLLVRVHSACLLRLLYTLNLKEHAIDVYVEL